MDDRDVLVAMTFSPYRAEIVEAVRLAVERTVPVIAITDSHGAPIVPSARQAFVVPNESPLPVSAQVAATARRETRNAIVGAESPGDVATSISTFHSNRRSAGIYHG
jgi:DNA-binding MurR/RpiR family transcriptional regulator